MRSRPVVVAFGDVNVDVVTRLPGHTPGGEVVAPATDVFPGGTVANTAAGLAALGVPVRFAGKIGRDAFGHFLRRDFESLGVDVRFLQEEPGNYTVMILAFIDGAGERHVTVWPPSDASHMMLRSGDFGPELYEGADWFHISGICLRQSPARETTLALLREARRRGLPVSFDLNLRTEFFGWDETDKSFFVEAASLSDHLLGSARDEIVVLAEAACGETAPPWPEEPSEDCPEPLLWAVDRLGRRERVTVARMGARGVWAVSPGETHFLPAFRVPVRDMLGSGDAFDSGYIAAAAAGLSLKEALRRGSGTAALNITRPGARGGITLAELTAFLDDGSLPDAGTLM